MCINCDILHHKKMRSIHEYNRFKHESIINTMKKIYRYTSMVALAAVLASCSTVPLSGRRQLSLVSDEQIQEQAAVAYKEFLNSSSTKVVTGTSNAALVKNEIGRASCREWVVMRRG